MVDIPKTKEAADQLLKEANAMVQTAWGVNRHLPHAQRDMKKGGYPVVLRDQSQGNIEVCNKLIDAAGKYEIVGAAYMSLGFYHESSEAFRQAVRIWSMEQIRFSVSDASLKAQNAAANVAAMTTISGTSAPKRNSM